MSQGLLFALACVCLVLASPRAMAELTAPQKQVLEQVKTHLTQGEANYRVAAEGVSGGQVTASRARLALTRLSPVNNSLAQAAARLKTLPGDEPEVKAQQDRHDTLAKAVADLQAALTGQPAAPAAPSAPAAPGAPAAPAPAAPANPSDTVRLNYKQEESLKNAEYHVREITGYGAALTQLAEQITKAEDSNRIDYRLMSRGMNTIVEARRKTGNAEQHLAALPANGAGVQAVATDLKSAVGQVDAAEKIIAPAHEKLMARIDPAKLPNLQTDLKRLSELATMYANIDILQSDRTRSAAVIGEIPQAAKEHDRIVAEYELLVIQQTEEGKRFEGTSRHFKEKLGQFVAAAQVQKAELPGQIDADIAKANEMADEAVANQRPAWFSGGIPQQVDFVVDKLVLLTALDAPAAAAKQQQLDQLRAQLKTKADSLREGIIAANNLPNDAFTGTDRKQIEEQAIAAWKKIQPNAEVLKVCIPSQNWQRETMWRYQNNWYLIDRSKVQAQVIVKHDDKLAVIRPVDMWIDHQANDERRAFPMDEAKDELPPHRYLPLEKVK